MPRGHLHALGPPVETVKIDRCQVKRGRLKTSDIFSFFERLHAPTTPSLSVRTAEYEKKTLEQRTVGYKHYQSAGARKNNHKDRKCLPALPHISNPALPKFGFPLGKFPLQKFFYDNLPREINPIDYGADEADYEYLEIINKARYRAKQNMISVNTLEHWLDRLEKSCLFKPKEILKLRDEDGNEIDDVCNVCLDGDTTNCNQIVYCEFCHLAVHQDCYGIPFLPEGALCCRRCGLSPGKLVRCELCPSQAGAFKQLANGKWVHVLCVIWVDETHFGNTVFMEYVQNVERAIHDRRALSCQLCKNKVDARRGACIQCSETKCTASFHVTCARNAGLVMRISETDDGHVNRFVWCMKHTPEETEEDIEQKERMIRNARRESERPLPTISMPTVTTKAISAIAAESPDVEDEDIREMIGYWYLKRMYRYGAPLLKKFSQPNDATSRRRLSHSMTLDPKVIAVENRMKAFQKDLNAIGSLADLVIRREEKKLALLKASMRLFERGFKPIEVLIAEIIERMVAMDTESIFTQPVTIPGYLDHIKKPICLQTMAERNKAGYYKSISALQEDLNLMVRNCEYFNVGNTYFQNYGKRMGKQGTKVMKVARVEVDERSRLKNDSAFVTQLLNGVMGEYTGWSNKRQEDQEMVPTTSNQERVEVEMTEVVVAQPPTKKRKRQLSPKVEPAAEVAEDIVLPPSTSSTTRSSSRKSGGQEKKEERLKEEKPSTSSYGTRSTTAAISTPSTSAAPATESVTPPQEPRWSGSSTAQTLRRQVETFGADVTPKSSRKGQSAPLRQTTISSFFSAVPKVQQVTFADVTPTKSSSFFDRPCSSKGTRSSSRSSTATVSSFIPSATMRSSFRMSSASLRSPLPLLPNLKKRLEQEVRDDDEEEELVVFSSTSELSPSEIEAERRRVAENEANSKYAHNQLVVVDGRAAKVIQEHLAHLGDVHRVQRQSMTKKKREVLGEILDQPSIYVEFFQKSSNLENFKWVDPDAVELLDINTTARIVGLRAAKDWYNRVMNGEDV